MQARLQVAGGHMQVRHGTCCSGSLSPGQAERHTCPALPGMTCVATQPSSAGPTTVFWSTGRLRAQVQVQVAGEGRVHLRRRMA